MVIAVPSVSKRQASTVLTEQMTPTKKQRTELQTPAAPDSEQPTSARRGRASSAPIMRRMRSESLCPGRAPRWDVGDEENMPPVPFDI